MISKNSAVVSYLMRRDTDEEYDKEMEKIEEKKALCKKLEFASKGTGLVGELLGDLPDPSHAAEGLAIVAKIAEAGIEITSTALECDDVNFDEIKLIMDKRFNEVDKKLDAQTEALDEISRKVSETLTKLDNVQSQMYRGFKIVLHTMKDSNIRKIINDINTAGRYFRETRKSLNSYPKMDYIDELSKDSSVLRILENYSDPGNSLYSALYKLIDSHSHLAIPENALDDNAFQALYALFYGTQTYFLVKVFLVKQYAYIANYNYEVGNFDKYNSQFANIRSIDTKFRNTLFSDVIKIIQEVKSKSFINEVKNEWFEDISEDVLLDLKKSIEAINLNLIDDVREMVEVKDIDFSLDITSKYGDWKDKSTVSYAVQLRNKNKYSAFSRWSKAEVIGNKANPEITVPQDNQGRERLIFRKFNKGPTQFIGAVKGSETKLRDIDRDLYNAAGRGDQDLAYSETKLLIEKGANINVVFEQGRNLLHAAALAGNDRVATDFLFNKLDINSKDIKGFTPLHLAAESNQIKFVQELIKQNADVNAQTADDQLTPLHIAAKNGYLESVTELMKSSNLAINAADKFGFTALHHATHKRGNAKIIRALLQNDDIVFGAKTKLGLAPLHLAAINGFPKVMESLYNDTNIDINETDKDGTTALHFAAMAGKYIIAKKLLALEKIAIDQATISNKWTPLHFAIYFKNEDIASELLDHPAVNIQSVGKNGITPLHLAIAAGQLRTAEKLLNKGADKEAKIEDDGSTALHLAMRRNKSDALLLLIRNKVNLNAQTKDGTSALHLAVKYRKIKFLEILLEANVDAKLVDSNGILAIQIAVDNMDLNFVRAIVEKYPSIADNDQTKEGIYLHALAHEKAFRVMYHYEKNKDSNEYEKYYGLEPLEVFEKLGVNELFNLLINPNNDPNQNNDNYNKLIKRVYETVILPCVEKEKKGTPCQFNTPLTSRFSRSIESKAGHMFANQFHLYSKITPRIMPPSTAENSIQLSLKQSADDNSFSNSASHFIQNMSPNGVLLLLDLLVRKFKNEKYSFAAGSGGSSLESRAKALNITEKFEELVDSVNTIPAKERFNLAEVSSKIYKALESENDSKIADILSSYVKEFLKPEETRVIISKLQQDDSNFPKELLGNILLSLKSP